MHLADAASDMPAKRRPNWELRILVPVLLVIGAVWFMYRASTGSPAPTPPIFASGLTLQEAQAAAKTTPGKGLVVANFTASWCPPCQRMKRTTWVDASVEAAIRASGVAVMVDVDEQSATAEANGIESMPTTVLFHGDKELSRVEGYVTAPALKRWIEQAGAAIRTP